MNEYKEVTTTDYGFETFNVYKDEDTPTSSRIRVTTDYAKANYVKQSTVDGNGGIWWLRSPCSNKRIYARSVGTDGYSGGGHLVDIGFVGVCPALCLEN